MRVRFSVAFLTNDQSRNRAEWNALLSTVELDTTGVPRDTLELFWSSLYRTYIAPVNVTGDNPLWASEEPYWDSFYCIWCAFSSLVHFSFLFSLVHFSFPFYSC